MSDLPSMQAKIQALKEKVADLLECKTELILENDVLSQSSPNISTLAHQPTLQSAAAPKDVLLDRLIITDNSTAVSVSLVAHNKILGVMHCQRKLRPFDDDEISLLKELSTQATIVIENTYLFESAQHQAMRISTVSEISKAITSILDIDLLLSSVASLIEKYLTYPYVYVFSLHRWHKKIQLRAKGTGDLVRDEDISFNESSADDVLLTKVIENQQTVLTSEIPQNHSLSQLPPIDARTELLVPLIFGNQVLGILCLRSEKEESFKQSDVFLLEMLSDSIAIAMRNANLYRSEQWRRQVAESMRDVAGLLSAEISLEHLLNQLLEELTKTLPSETAAIWLIENSESNSGIGQFTSPLRLAALHSPNDVLFDLVDQSKLSASEEWLTDILENHYPHIHDTDANNEPFGDLFGYPKNYSAIISPLWVGLQPLGILVLAHPQPARYGSEAQSIMATFGSYAAIAIKNAELYQAAHDQAWVSTVLLQVAEATQSINNLDELAHTVVQIIPQLVGVDSCVILLWDKTVEELSPFAASGLTSEQQDLFYQLHIQKNQFAEFDHVLISREPIIINRSLENHSENSSLLTIFNLEKKLAVIFPMISQTEIQGAILVNFGELNSDQNDNLWEEKFVIIQGIAHQTAVATENIKLIRSQEEEAYVSIALLQVAQAIVNAIELEDILSVVTRITPILVAMRRCAIYLWDFDRKVFICSQSYGISRLELSETPQYFKPSLFPLLECVRQSNQIACHLISNDTFSYSNWFDLDENNCLLVDSPSGSTEDATDIASRDLLASKTALLLAYPLSIKGTVLGVMVTEEELTDRGVPSYHIRERRMEIVTGITQQAALALQNDMLQRDAIQRERFDRELQLAREIQSNFMPEEMPRLDGWELDAKWKPARQVGGDYYDVFELPNGCIGLVIADVADKGMPAALFMTLVRTLLRATIRDNKSPADALREVNELLVPDAKNGMFVTLVYGILHLDTGNFVYANAGHVPPVLLVYDGRDLLDLPPGGMALGVLQDITIEERQVRIFPGDTLVFYTDGVSEAFSPTGDMYGVNRLKQLILSAETSSATQLLDMIVDSVNEFISSAPVADDLTLLALHREPVK